MGQQLPDRNGLVLMKWVSDLKREMAVDIVIQLELATLPQLHDRSPGNRLRDRRDIHKRVWSHQDILLDI